MSPTPTPSAAPSVSLIDKLRKVLALTNSPVENEAQAAAEHLRRLLTTHNLSMADLEAKGGHASPGVRQSGIDLGKAAFKWKLELADRIAEFYYCHPIVDHHDKTVVFVGRPDNVESLSMLYTWVIDQIKRLATEARRTHFDTTGEHIDPLRWQLGFGEGAVRRLHERLREMRAREQEDALNQSTEQSTALVVMSDKRKEEISDWLESQGMSRIDGRKTKAEQEWEKRWEAHCARLQAIEDAKTPEQKAREQAEREARLKEIEARERRNARRRARYEPKGRYRSWETEEREERRDEQSSRAYQSGKDHASRINLQPFISGDVPNEAKRRLKDK